MKSISKNGKRIFLTDTEYHEWKNQRVKAMNRCMIQGMTKAQAIHWTDKKLGKEA